MLLLVTILLVLVAAVTLLIGIFSDNLPLIFVSIGASALAAIVLAVVSQRNRRRGGLDSGAATGGPPAKPAKKKQWQTSSAFESGPKPAPQPTAATAVASEPPTTSMPVSPSGPPPIDGYDALRVNQIQPLLADLDLDELEELALYEESHKNRTTVLNAIDERMDALEAAAAGTSSTATDHDEMVADAVTAIEKVGEPVRLDDAAVEGDRFPIPDYDDLDEDEIIDLLDDLDADELEMVADREEAGQNRDSVLDAVDDRLDILEGIAPAPSAIAPATKKAPAKKAPAKKAPAKKATPTKATAEKAPAKKAAAKKATAKKAATPTKKATAAGSSAAAKKAAAPAKKSGVTKKAAPVDKAAPAKKAASAKKAPAIKKVTKR